MCRGISAAQRGAPTAVATSTPPSTMADTTWAKTWGWISPPIEPWTTHGRPSRKSIPGVSVCIVRLRGARELAWPGSRRKNAPRFW